MDETNLQKFCPRCGSPKSKTWDQLSADEKFMVERLPPPGESSSEERRRHRFCARCLYEDVNTEAEEA